MSIIAQIKICSVFGAIHLSCSELDAIIHPNDMGNNDGNLVGGTKDAGCHFILNISSGRIVKIKSAENRFFLPSSF